MKTLGYFVIGLFMIAVLWLAPFAFCQLNTNDIDYPYFEVDINSFMGTNIWFTTQPASASLEINPTGQDIVVTGSNGNTVASMDGLSANTPTNSYYPNWTRPESTDSVEIYVYTADGKKWKAIGWQTVD